MKKIIALATLGLLFTGCAKNKDEVEKAKPVNTEKLSKEKRQGYPDWITNPYTKGFEPSNSVCASAQSTMGLGSGNIDAARSDAEIQVKNRVAEQV